MATDAARRDARPLDVRVDTLLGRRVIDVGAGELVGYVSGATVLVTGAAGSVGSELCARLTRLGPRGLVLVDQAEAPLVELASDLRYDHGFAAAFPVLADIRNRARTLHVFERYRPDVVFHAAAYKQVPLLEANPVDAVATNVLGTKWLLDAAARVGVDRFVLFSSDKAVHPTSVLGQTKAVAEWILEAAGHEAPHGRYASIRLVNVVDSAGSMLPRFRHQVDRGGPVTVTDPRMTRYLMTAGEAAGLALVAGGLADSSGIFWLDLRPPIRVLDLARRIVEAAARDVAIEFVGLRPGERLHEHLFWEHDEIVATPCERVFRSPLRSVDRGRLTAWIDALERQVDRASTPGVRAVLAEMHGAEERDAVRSTAVLVR
ncbi:MAG TPA: polysaccharide biosynthesis protein [Gaiellaceae bacterium]|nr:polysaccharide biosynthesis protein [Gaiellaceae bacterium]